MRIGPQLSLPGSPGATTGSISTAGRAAALTSSGRMRPRVPLPDTWRRSTPSSRATLRAEGPAGIGSDCTGGAPGAGSMVAGLAAGTGSSAVDSAAGTAAAGVSSPSVSGSIVSSVCPTLIVSPGLTWILRIFPGWGQGSSKTALSVSSSRIPWLPSICWPSLTSNETTSAESTFSPNSGSLNSMVISTLS